MGTQELVGMKSIAYRNWKRQMSKMKAGVGSMPGTSHEEGVKERHEQKLISGRGVIP